MITPIFSVLICFIIIISILQEYDKLFYKLYRYTICI